MAFQLSPGVNVSEIDLTTIIPAVGTTEAAFVGKFVWGPVNDIVTVSSEVDLVNTYGKPDSNTAIDFFTAANFLAYGRNLKIVRAAAPGLYNATSTGDSLLIKNNNDYVNNFSSNASTYGAWAAKYSGQLGNSLKVSVMASSNSNVFSSWAYGGYFDGAPSTSTYAINRGSTNAGDEMHIVVVDEDGLFTGIANTVLEKFAYVSKASDAIRDDGSSNYYKNVINQSSKYIWSLTHPTSNALNWGTVATPNLVFGSANAVETISLANGTYGQAVTANVTSAYDKFKNADETDISLVLTGAHGSNVATYVISNITEYRKDCIAFISPDLTDVVNVPGSEVTNAITTRNKLTSTSYAFMDSGWKYQFDKYNNTYRWLPLNGDIAGLCVKTDYERDPWFSPAGFNRGQIKNVVKLAWNPNKTDRDNLYKSGVNPVVTFPGEGTILFGDKTMLSKPSAFDRINVRRLFIVLEKAIARAAKFSLFEFNDAFTRAQFVSLVEPFLRDVQGRRGIYDFRVVCDETNNTPEVIDRNEFVGDIYIKPARSINFIQLNFVAVRTGVSFDEIVGKF
jgi:hypothetical protein